MFAYLGDVILVDKFVLFGNIIFTGRLENKQRKKCVMNYILPKKLRGLTLLLFLVIKNIPFT